MTYDMIVVEVDVDSTFTLWRKEFGMRLSKLIGKIHEDHGNVLRFCEKYGIDFGYMSRVLNGKHDIKKSTIVKLVGLLSINPSDIGVYFFPECFDGAEEN